MNQRLILSGFILLALFSMGSCCKKTSIVSTTNKENPIKAGPAVIIYKTKLDYSQLVPVILSADKKSIVSFPAVTDVFYQGELAYPSQLKKGFLLDNRGIGPNVAFLDYTYKAYANFKTTPSLEVLEQHLLEREPLLVMYNCGIRYDYKDIIPELNALIEAGKLDSFTKLY